jgi:hypothetical protein
VLKNRRYEPMQDPPNIYSDGVHQESDRIPTLVQKDVESIIVQSVSHAEITGSSSVDFSICNSMVLSEVDREFLGEMPCYFNAPLLPNSLYRDGAHP